MTSPAAIKMLLPNDTIGILGAGQLGQMLAMAAISMGLKIVTYDPSQTSPAFDVSASHFCAPWDDVAALEAFAKKCDLVTFEFENVPVTTLAKVAEFTTVAPSGRSLEICQDRLAEKNFVRSLGFLTAPFADIKTEEDLRAAHKEFGGRAILKTRRMGYDGRGQVRLNNDTDLSAIWAEMGGQPLVLEGFVDFTAETSAIVARAQNGEIATWDCPNNVHGDGILRTSTLPGPLSGQDKQKLQEQAAALAKELGHIGVLTVEVFVGKDGALIINEMAPRVHNSGHWTIEGAPMSQFEGHMRAIAGWPLGDTQARAENITMTNLIGDDCLSWAAILADPKNHLHLYGKGAPRPGRKMGHVTKIGG